MSVKFFQKLAVASDMSKFNYLPYIAELFTIMAGVLITTTSIIGSGMLIATISERPLAQISDQPLQNSGYHSTKSR